MDISEKVKVKCLSLYNDGWYISEIAKKLRLSRISVHNIIWPDRAYTDEKIVDKIIDMYCDQTPLREISETCNVSISTVNSLIRNYPDILRYNNCKYSSLSKLQFNKIKRLYLKGKSITEIEAYFKHKIPYYIIRYRLQRAGLYKKQNSRVTVEERKQMYALHLEGYTYSEIGERFKRDRHTVSKNIKIFLQSNI